jgi:isoleucyl-tRNA synthetase
MAPVLSFTAEEVWGYLKTEKLKVKSEEIESVFLSNFPVVKEEFLENELEEKWKDLLDLRNEINKALEIKRAEKFIGNSLEAKIKMRLPEKYRVLVAAYAGFLPAMLLVSAVEITGDALTDAYESGTIEGLQVSVERAPGEKCQRCWNWSTKVGTFGDEPDLCERCYPVVKG